MLNIEENATNVRISSTIQNNEIEANNKTQQSGTIGKTQVGSAIQSSKTEDVSPMKGEWSSNKPTPSDSSGQTEIKNDSLDFNPKNTSCEQNSSIENFYKNGENKAEEINGENKAEETNQITEQKKSCTDFDIRELMKLLIAAFSELRTADRERALNILTATVAALESKINAMEKAKDEQFKASMATAIGQIAGGALSIGTAGVGLGLNLKGPKSITSSKFEFDTNGVKIGETTTTKMTKNGAWADFFTNGAMPLGKIIEGSAGAASAAYGAQKSEADIEATKMDALLEILRQANEQYRKSDNEGAEIINKLLNMMQQLIQSAAQTERATAANGS